MGTKKSQRSVLGARLVARLTGPARLLAMSWSLEELSGTHGARNLLSKLEQSPLVRKQLPNTAAVLQQYFNYRRQGHENINAYLARESLYYLEALMALHGGHRGHAGLLDPAFLDKVTADERIRYLIMEPLGEEHGHGRQGQSFGKVLKPGYALEESEDGQFRRLCRGGTTSLADVKLAGSGDHRACTTSRPRKKTA